ncbi:MAG: hypothetical protein ABI142_04695 [Bryocella sp.]
MRIAALLLSLLLLPPMMHAQLGHHSDFETTPPLIVAPLPSNYKTILDNPDVLVMHVHYGAHETVPMHDHPAVATMYVYLNDSGPVDIIHENSAIAHRPPTHTGAFRIAPGIAERHSVVSHSDTDSDFLRVEFKNVTFPKLPEAGKHFAATTTPGITTEFQNDAITISRVICSTSKPCELPSPTQRALLIPINVTAISRSGVEGPDVPAGIPRWLPPSDAGPYSLRPGSNALLISFSDAPAASKLPCKF